MRNAVLIISHKRSVVMTVKALQNAGFEGDWFIVADDMDDTEYEKLYSGHVIRFDKREYAAKVDTVDNFGRLTSAVYARNACFDIAKRMDYDCFGLFDDDILNFAYRYECDGKLKSKPIKRLTPIFDAYCRFIVDNNFASGGFVPSGKLIGGAANPIAQRRFYDNPTNVYIINTHIEQNRFKGTIWEDAIYNFTNNMTGKVVCAFLPITFTMVPPASMCSGGNHDLYVENQEYICESYGNIAIPSFFRWKKGAIGSNFRHDLPRIISGKWRKYRA